MLIYSTRFRVKASFDENEFIKSVIDWNRSGQYRIDDIEKDSLSFIAGDDDRYLEADCIKDKRIAAAKMHIKNNGGVWETEMVLDCEKSIISVYVNRIVTESTQAPESAAYMTRYVDMLIKKGFADKSAGLEISDKALYISDKTVLENAIAASDKYSLPMIYLSADSKLNENRIAQKMSGLAVVVCDRESVLKDNYPEPIYIFFPHKNKKPVSLGDYPFHREIQRVVFDYLNSREYNRLETWDGVQNEITDRKTSALLSKYKKAYEDNDALTEMYDQLEKELAAESEQRNNLSYEVNMLRAENARLTNENMRLSENGTPIIMHGEENDYYEDEQREVIMDILAEYLAKSVTKGSRRADIIESVIKANSVKGTPKKYREIIKSAVNGYKNFDSGKIAKALKETGIEIIEHTGHYKIAFHGDRRYTCEAAATCGDAAKGGKNLFSEIDNTMF